ncbi:MAG: hypothetical protein QXL15_03130 [Candidatus Korarchaeota archaeon]
MSFEKFMGNIRVWYPWTHYAQEFVKLKYPTLDDVFKSNSPEVKRAVEIAVMFIRAFLEPFHEEDIAPEKELHPSRFVTETYATILSYPIANILVSHLPERARFKYAEKWAKRAEYYLINPPKLISDTDMKKIILEIARNTFGMNVVAEEVRSPTHGTISTYYKIDFVDYLNAIEGAGGEEYSLALQELEDGFVILKDLIFVIREALRKKIIEITSQEAPLSYQVLQEGMKEISQLASFYISQKESSAQSIKEFPPCMMRVIERLKKGENPSHFERLFLAIYLVNKNVPNDDIIKIFSSAPDFKEKIVRYHVEFIRKKGYISYSCDKIKAHGFCFANEKCANLKNPLQYR